MSKRKSRKEQRDERSEKVAREVRYQLANHGRIIDNQKLYDLLWSWMRVAKNNKYKRP